MPQHFGEDTARLHTAKYVQCFSLAHLVVLSVTEEQVPSHILSYQMSLTNDPDER
jgi:hypothetical protein